MWDIVVRVVEKPSLSVKSTMSFSVSHDNFAGFIQEIRDTIILPKDCRLKFELWYYEEG